jgi:hypothetical protein
LDKIENWQTWSISAMSVLTLNELWDTTANKPKAAGTKAANAKAKLILLAGSQHNFMLFEAGDAAAGWDKLKQEFIDQVSAKQTECHNRLTRIKLGQGEGVSADESITQFLQRAEMLQKAMEMTGFKIPECIVVSSILDGVPDPYRMVADQLKAMTAAGTGTVAGIKPVLMAHEATLKAREKDATVPALAMGTRGGYNGGRRQQRQQQSRPQPPRQQQPQQPREESKKEWQPRCFKCKELGHVRHDCPLLQEKPQQNHHGGRRNNFVMISTVAATELEKARDAVRGHADWKLDTAAATHVTDCKEDLVDFASVEDGPIVEGAFKEARRALGYGKLELTTVGGGREVGVEVTNVWYVPGIGHRLLSMSALDEKGYKAQFGAGQVSVGRSVRQGLHKWHARTVWQEIMRGRLLSDKLYHLDVVARRTGSG